MDPSMEYATAAERFAERIGLAKPESDDADFWDGLEQRFGPLARRISEAHRTALETHDPAERRGRIQDVYDLKNTSLDLSLAVTGQFRGVLLRSLMQWLEVRRPPAPRRVLDLGCDIGVVACFLATLYPEAQIHGVDTSRPALRRATELARQVNATNIQFEAADARTYAEAVAHGYFDLVVAANVYEYVVGPPPAAAHYRLASARQPKAPEQVRAAVGGVARSLSATGVFVSVEQFDSSLSQWWWMRTLNEAGLSIEWDQAAQLRTDLEGDAENPDTWATVPLTVASRLAPHRAATLDDFLASAAASDVRRREQVLGGRDVYEGALAEAIFEALSPKYLVRGAEAVYGDGGGQGAIPLAERLEVWEVGALAAAFGSTNDGLRRSLEIRSKTDLRMLLDEMDARAREAARAHDAHVRIYATVEERDQTQA